MATCFDQPPNVRREQRDGRAAARGGAISKSVHTLRRSWPTFLASGSWACKGGRLVLRVECRVAGATRLTLASVRTAIARAPPRVASSAWFRGMNRHVQQRRARTTRPMGTTSSQSANEGRRVLTPKTARDHNQQVFHMIGRRLGAHSGDKLPGSVAGFMQPARPMTRSLKVLIVDDEPDILRIGELSLGELARWNVVVAHNSEEALAIARSDQLDVILLDMMLPDADVQTTIRNLKANSAACLILLTAAGGSDKARACLDIGASGVICKPFDPIELPSRILHILETDAANRGGR